MPRNYFSKFNNFKASCELLINQSINQSVSQSVRQSVCLSIKQSLYFSVNGIKHRVSDYCAHFSYRIGIWNFGNDTLVFLREWKTGIPREKYLGATRRVKNILFFQFQNTSTAQARTSERNFYTCHLNTQAFDGRLRGLKPKKISTL